MRVPQMPYMDRVIGNQRNSLLNFINARTVGSDQVKTIPYNYDSKNTFFRYNDISQHSGAPLTGDPFRIGKSKGGALPDDFATRHPGEVWISVISDFLSLLHSSVSKGHQMLMGHDSVSVRAYMQRLGYKDDEITWLETFGDATGHYDASLVETVIEEWIFSAVPPSMWVAVEGGFSRVVNGMLKVIKAPVQLSQRVTRIDIGAGGRLAVTTKSRANAERVRMYDHVIGTTALGPLQDMDLDGLNLSYEKKLALRKLNYDPAAKIGIKFKTRWWEKLPLPIVGGRSQSDLPIRNCVFPSYGIDTPNAAAAMIASYVSDYTHATYFGTFLLIF